ncbi:MAG: phage portal protein [Methyloversatilis sp.]|nr:phage portal protein [Methyloversatilis sp.]
MKATGLSASMHTAHVGASRTDVALSNWNPFPGSADSDLLPDLDMLVARSRDLSRNNGIAAGAGQTFKDNIVGSVLRLVAAPDYRLLGWTPEQAREWANETEPLFRSWADSTECDAAGEQDLLGLTLSALGGTFGNGDALGLPLWLPDPQSQWSTRMLMVESDRLSTPDHLEHRDDIRGGIERDFYGKPIAYHIQRRHPGDALARDRFVVSGLNSWERIPATTDWGRRRVIHLHDKDRTGQSRGKPIVSAVMKEFHMAGKYQTTELEAAVSNALVAAFLESNLDQESAQQLFGNDPRDAWGASVRQAQNLRQMRGAAIIPLPAGAKLTPFAPGRPNAAFEAFMIASLRHIAAGMNIPYELLLKDFSKTNYSSARAALLEAWRYFMGRRAWLTRVWLRPIYELWLEEAVNAGRVHAPDFYEKRYAYARCRFIFSGRGWIDPVKEAEAAGIRMRLGISTLEAECAEQGLDWEEVLEQQAAERAVKQRLGLPLDIPATSGAPASPGTQRAPQNEDAPEDQAA